jgi:hypothetical protein
VLVGWLLAAGCGEARLLQGCGEAIVRLRRGEARRGYCEAVVRLSREVICFVCLLREKVSVGDLGQFFAGLHGRTFGPDADADTASAASARS